MQDWEVEQTVYEVGAQNSMDAQAREEILYRLIGDFIRAGKISESDFVTHLHEQAEEWHLQNSNEHSPRDEEDCDLSPMHF